MIPGCVAVLSAAALLFPQASSARLFPVPGYGELVLQEPGAWKSGLRRPAGNLPPTFLFSPSSGAPFEVLVTAGGFLQPGAQPMDAAALRNQVQAMAMGAEAKSVEKSLAVKELKGPAAFGFYFSATDKAPEAGEFKYLTQGAARVGGILVIFTILTNDGQEIVAEAALEMMRGASMKDDY
jgi:hypothetical protein